MSHSCDQGFFKTKLCKVATKCVTRSNRFVPRKNSASIKRRKILVIKPHVQLFESYDRMSLYLQQTSDFLGHMRFTTMPTPGRSAN